MMMFDSCIYFCMKYRRGNLVLCVDVQKKDLSKPNQQGLKAKLTIVNLAGR